MEKTLKLYKYLGGGVESTPFPNAESQIEIGGFRYDAKRMGGAPTITASVNYPSCLDNQWTDNVYAEFKGEKYFLKQTPTSSYNNGSTMYKHDLELVSERSILNDVYFFDTVVGSPQGNDKPVSNSTKVTFFGNIREFVARLNSSLQYAKLQEVSSNGTITGYHVVVDDDVVTEEKMMSFENQFFANVLQEIYNSYEVPYYFEGKTIHIGFAKNNVSIPTLSYGVDNALVSISKNNANYKIVNRATGTGSSDNIPFYYPNNSPKGEIEAKCSSSSFGAKIVDYELYSNAVDLDGVITRSNIDYDNLEASHFGEDFYSGQSFSAKTGAGGISKEFVFTFDTKDIGDLLVSFESRVTQFKIGETEINDANFEVRYSVNLRAASVEAYSSGIVESLDNFKVPVKKALNGYILTIKVHYTPIGKYAGKAGSITYNASYKFGSESGWTYNGKSIELKDVGLRVSGTPSVGDTITQTLVKYITTSPVLMPSIYRKTDGAERFYNATNNTYEDITFNNPYVEGRPKEHIITVDDIKPTIKGVEFNGLRIDMFSEFAYDDDDNDETYEDEEGNVFFKHPYFYGKLRIMDFNLFDHAIEQQPMTISFTSGDAGACNFEIGVTEEYPQKNPVQVDDDGNLIRDENGMVLAGVEGTQQVVDSYQDRQQDTSQYEVWIALRKEESTYGTLMPRAPKYDDKGVLVEAGHRPKACTKNPDGTVKNDGDTFVILGINLPKSYIVFAEEKLEAEIIRYIKANNDEKFTFSIGFSRIFFEENEEVLKQLDENAKITIAYNGKEYDLYVSSFAYSMSEGDVLPEIRVELDDTLKVSQNALQNAISQVKGELGASIQAISNEVAMQRATYIPKQEDDDAHGTINFTKGLKFGEGSKVEILDDNSAKLTIEYLEVTKKASFTSLEIQEKTHVGGQLLITPAAINCGEVEEFEDFYRCYFQTKGAEGDEIFNQFAVGDQAICQTYNAWGSKYYWRLVVGIGEDYIDLSKTECDEESGIPSAGDKIIQLGNQEDVERQNAIVIAAYGDGSPYIIQYKGINSFALPEEKVVTKLSSTENIFTGTVHIKENSDGLENIAGLPEFIQEKIDDIEVGGQNMLRNSGFTGDYLSAQLADQHVMDAADAMFNPPLIHWDDVDAPALNAEVKDSTESQSGKEVILSYGAITQRLYQRIVANETYMLTFKAKGTSLTYSVGGVTRVMALTGAWRSYAESIKATEGGLIFRIFDANCYICDLQLERGTVATAWSNSYLDNASDRAYWQSRAYIDAAIREGSTTIGGGLVLTNHIKVGNYANGDMTQETAGMNGTYHNDNDVAFWAGGTDAQAIKAIAETGEDEANFAVSHGGKLVANQAVIRGKIYAEDGEFKGRIEAYEGVFGGFVKKKVTEVKNSNINDIAPLRNNFRTITPKTAGSLMYLTPELTEDVDFQLPHLWKGVVYDATNSGYTATEIREMIGSEIVIYNQSNTFSHVCGYSFDEESGIFQSLPNCPSDGAINPLGFCHAKCLLGIDENGYEVVYWKLRNGMFDTI